MVSTLPPSMNVSFFREAPKPSKPFQKKGEIVPDAPKKKVTRDTYWNLLYKGAQNTNTDNDFCVRLADTIWKANEHYKKEYKKMCEQRTQFLKKAPQQMITKAAVKKCAGFNINGLQCGFKATCGNFCKRHSQDKKEEVPDVLKEDPESDSDSDSASDHEDVEELELDLSDGELDVYD